MILSSSWSRPPPRSRRPCLPPTTTPHPKRGPPPLSLARSRRRSPPPRGKGPTFGQFPRSRLRSHLDGGVDPSLNPQQSSAALSSSPKHCQFRHLRTCAQSIQSDTLSGAKKTFQCIHHHQGWGWLGCTCAPGRERERECMRVGGSLCVCVCECGGPILFFRSLISAPPPPPPGAPSFLPPPALRRICPFKKKPLFLPNPFYAALARWTIFKDGMGHPAEGDFAFSFFYFPFGRSFQSLAREEAGVGGGCVCGDRLTACATLQSFACVCVCVCVEIAFGFSGVGVSFPPFDIPDPVHA